MPRPVVPEPPSTNTAGLVARLAVWPFGRSVSKMVMIASFKFQQNFRESLFQGSLQGGGFAKAHLAQQTRQLMRVGMLLRGKCARNFLGVRLRLGLIELETALDGIDGHHQTRNHAQQ